MSHCCIILQYNNIKIPLHVSLLHYIILYSIIKIPMHVSLLHYIII